MLPTLRIIVAPTLNPTGATKMDIWDDKFEEVVIKRLKAEYENAKSSEKDKRENSNQQQAAVIAAVVASVL